MEKEKLNNQTKSSNKGYVIVPNYFLREGVKVLGIGPALLYLQLLSYCHKEKDIAWPTLTTLSNKLGISKNSLLSYRKILLKYGLIKKIVRRKSVQGNYQSNLYKITPIESGANIELRQVQILGEGSANTAPGVVQNLHPNNTNLKHYQGNNSKEREDAVVAVVDFKKLKEKGDLSACNAQAEEKMRAPFSSKEHYTGQAPYSSKEHYTGQAIKERMVELDFKEEFIEKILKEYSMKKIDEKLDLLMKRKNIKNPAGWLRTALKNDYREEGEERYDEESAEKSENPVNTPGWTSREKALEAIKLIKDNLSLPVYPPSLRGREPEREKRLITEN